MCTTCGCSGATHDRAAHPHAHSHADSHHHAHDHHHAHAPGHEHGELHALEHRLLERNDRQAAANRARLSTLGVTAVNIVSSPGAGKTTLLERTIGLLEGSRRIQVIEGDQSTERDAERIRRAGAQAVQVNTGTGCHLDAAMVARAMEALPLEHGDLLLIENVGNLVCPALFDLGEQAKVVVASVTEGEDKPLKYPHMFRAARLVLLNKTDLLPHVDFDVGTFTRFAHEVNPDVEVLPLSARSGAGLAAWCAWLAPADVPA